MALRRRLVLGLLTATSLLFIYILCVQLDRPLSPLKRLQFLVQGESSVSPVTEEPPPVYPDPDPEEDPPSVRTQTSKTQSPPKVEHKPTESNNVLNVPQPSSRPADDSEETRKKMSTRAPTPKPQKPTESPFIGDSYYKEDVHPQTNCPDGIQSRIPKTEFGERYLKTVPVLQWAKHVTPEEHARLSKFSGAHGWTESSYELLMETLTVLNTSANMLLLDDWNKRGRGAECTRCAVVGNGGILNGSKKGAEIDGHHYVFRTNGAVIQGFEQDVGSRTTHYTFSINTMKNSLLSYRRAGYTSVPMSNETRYVFIPDHDRDYLMMKAAATHTLVKAGREQGKDPTTYFGKDVSVEKLKMYHPDFLRYTRNRFLRSKILNGKQKFGYRPTTGAVMLLAALHTCDKVSAYGFITPDFMNYSDHYYDKIYHRLHFYVNHDMRMEMVLWQQLHQAGLIRLYMRDLKEA